jgi:uncharacterized membrane-anchored protein YitT (DUF2179 family)
MRFLARLTLLTKRAIRREAPGVLRVTVGTVLYALAISMLVLPYRFPSTGFTGISILLNYTLGTPVGFVNLLFNIGLFALGWRVLPKRFLFLTAYSVLLFSGLLDLFRLLPAPPLTDKLLAVLTAAAINGISGALVFNAGGSMGGTDILAAIVRRKTGMEIGKFTFWINSFVLVPALFIVGIENTLYAVAMLFAGSTFLDGALRSFDRCAQVFIISEKHVEVRRYILEELRRGASVIHSEGAYTGQERPIVMSLLLPRQVADLKIYLAEHDPGAFLIQTDATEVFGKGFKHWKSTA